MTKYDADWVRAEEAKRKYMAENGLYSEEEEHSSCGVGLVVNIDGSKSRAVVENGIAALKAIWHRGAVDADGKTGDGAGIHVQIPVPFFYDQIERTGHRPRKDQLIAVGQVFLPRTNFAAQETCRTIVESEVLRMGYNIYGWRHVPVNVACLGEKANATRPEIEQILISNSKGVDEETFERELYVIRRRIEKAALAAQAPQLYIASLSCRSIIYKGMMLAEQVAEFYPDLMDERFESAFAIYHQRYSTNTFPQWWLAQPFRMLAHNGEINTLKGNLNWMKSHEIRMASSTFGEMAEDIKPIVASGSSDSAALDAVFEVLVRAGRNAPMAKTMLVPESWSKQAVELPQAWRDMYSYCNSVIEPWDGPAALAMTDGRWVCAGLDRNGLRPMRYVVTNDGMVIAGSEAGMVPLDESRIVRKGALGPGQLLAVDMTEGKLFDDAQIKDQLAASQPFGDWVGKIKELGDSFGAVTEKALFSGGELRRRQIAAGFSVEDLEQVLAPMAEDGKEALASMGDDTPSAVLSKMYRPLSHFFRQNFSQVTNPPIDSLREFRVMSLKTRFGNLKNVLDEDSSQTEILTLDSPFVGNAQWDELTTHFNANLVEIDCTFAPGENTLSAGLARIRAEAEDAVRSGAGHIVLTDHHSNADKVAMPMILATSAVHSHLTRKGLRTFCSLNVRCAECMDAHYFAVLVGCGATIVNAYLAEDSIADRIERGLLDGNLTDAIARYREAIDQGLLKILAKMGISVVSSYRGGLNFEAVGLSRAMCAEYFPGMTSRISGIGVTGIQSKVEDVHARGWLSDAVLPIGGFYKARKSGETHAWEATSMHMLQMACNRASFELWKQYSAKMRSNPPIHLRDLLDIKPLGKPVPLEEVESITSIRKRFVTPGMSLGALSPEAHKTLNVAMNRIGAKSDSGEGGEDPAHFVPEANGDNPSAKIKQVASGRFGVTAEYLNQCEELEIKVAQGAKPGEGGQLPGMKVTDLIARLRHSTKGVTLISPPPHHDIYSIEDLAQLIYDLKQINPRCKVTVKLVASSGVGTIAAGVAKAKADIILISGHNGGTGASPATSIKYAGLPWEMGLTEAHQVLAMNNLRDRVTLRTDGGLRTGRDIVMAAMMGAEEYGIGTAALIAMGCIMVRQCQSNTCPVGVCTQDEALRGKFTGNADKVVNLITFYAQEVRELLASIGARSLDDVIGRADLLAQVSRGSAHLDDLDLNPLLITVDGASEIVYNRDKPRNVVLDTLDAQIVRDAARFLEDGEKMQLSYAVQNTHRTVGTRISSHIVRKFGMRNTLQPDHLTVKLTGSAGQSLGAFAAPGLKLEVSGDANDYVGKGLSGGTIVVRPPMSSSIVASENTIIGNTVLYGATAGYLFAAGRAGERFAVRNSGASVVIEGCGSNGCEYMTGGVAVILGDIGANFGAGMTGGMAYLYDPEGKASAMMNRETLVTCPVTVDHWHDQLETLLERHLEETGSQKAADILQHWDIEQKHFMQVCPKEMLVHLPAPLSIEEKAIPAE
ncbi:glutamate synthase large subunit [Sulfitobacter pseudonitzschiae]|uniref:Glutamate synthase [NADPH] large chain n=1 Tax=Pseudosulfitobacter pseudonitzschiae TaxID=1402135 RepID=A0A9Q2RTR5_9RHOB|nr:glutamate synthase large subunit [Pseudosulfitobacter pseudonitzschiae]MBM2290758.1 glutamate synthase large subunit [Pseudosulfitobacter pseudonitzschiae]MBM2295676.1 glutamate synthase large subunit [Pseudosulfitobacter pseudonitzschiae]MBM2300588.1 glutamate synthase large subunit [Pseudosulfitobacter pseudonitzschiae]MBM2310373.1 glutamate synthase large subunit [Pseudosulfitobacter pseudonitzschiae]MBM2315285.1 glutamate synthase large subunit [Pseudosulfitobacter pseudonitzschiae]